MTQNLKKINKTDLIRQFQTVEANEARFRTITEFAPVMLWLTDGEGKSLFYNKKWQQFTGFSGIGDPGSVWLGALHPTEKENCLASFRVAFKAQRPFQMEYQLRRHDGEYRWIQDMGEPYYGTDGSFIGFIGSSQDITERKLAEKSLQRSFAELNRHDRENTLLGEMNSCLQVCRSMAETYPVVSLFAKRLFDHNAGVICIINESRSLVEAIVEWGPFHGSATVFNLDDCWALRQGKLHQVDDPKAGLLCWHVKRDAAEAYLCVPMGAYGETRGILHLQLPQNDETEAVKNLAQVFANQIALALTNLKLREALQHQSVRDPLTQLFNRRYLLESMERELARAKRGPLSVGILLIDVDHFKRFNDTQGHDAGDALLRQFGELLKSQTRGEDIPCRYGGEEFILVLTGIDRDNLMRRAEEIRVKTQKLSVQYRGAKLDTVTISIGAALFPQHGQKPDELITAADKALYQAKRTGRDRVVLVDSDAATSAAE
ncbi:MAG: hypothetical protein CVV13_11060 [Gammaproteobacteria bacterium HGW-Gammaproteobacteria-3]|nr:MAG: hypothetical protein CVV13_11060 [Gammaproteobacteria bacterium HGW-Gammaproteobacteria-3]